jgi:8-oxo-dGTP pyrophosphatase MutT (NUDIX family)
VEWTVHGERAVYESDWMRVVLADVELPDGNRFEHHVMRTPNHATGTVVHDPERGVLLLWRHRFIVDVWAWEIPAGRVDPGEVPIDAAAREVLEETGWRPGPLRPLASWNVASGITDNHFDAYIAAGATHVGEPEDVTEAERVEWLPIDRVREALGGGEIVDGPTLAALTYALAFDLIG